MNSHICDHPNSGFLAGANHSPEGVFVTTLRVYGVAHRLRAIVSASAERCRARRATCLIVDPPLIALNMLLGWGDLDPAIA